MGGSISAIRRSREQEDSAVRCPIDGGGRHHRRGPRSRKAPGCLRFRGV